MTDIGDQIYALAARLFPIHRSITGNGVRETLKILKEYLPDLVVHEVPSGTEVNDWTIPKEWNVFNAYVISPSGEKIIDFKENNLHILGYSIPVNKKVSLKELHEHLYSLPRQPDAIPYITSYYEERWGFCVSDMQKEQITEDGEYTVVIDSDLSDGSLTFGELLITGVSEKEIFISTYICHPSMANNELSGPSITTILSKWIVSVPRRFSYRIIFIPETIGSITYISQNLDEMKQNIIAGYNVTCAGDDRVFSFLPSRQECSLADQAALHVLKNLHPDYIHYSYLERGSDERQYCAPGVDLPVASVMRSKYGTYPEYHTSLDNMDIISPSGLAGTYDVLKKCIEIIESNDRFKVNVLCEPKLDKRGLYPTLSTKETSAGVRDMMNLIAYCDGNNTLLEIAEKIHVPVWDLIPIVNKLVNADVLVNES